MLQFINQISIKDILDKLWLPYKNLWNWTLWIFENWKITDGRKVNIRENYIHDFSWKNRAIGPPFSVVQKYLNLSTRETFKFFEENFNTKPELINKNKKSKKQKKSMVTTPYSRQRLTK
jgi:hypothetical protein